MPPPPSAKAPDRARRLLERGPPLDPAALGLTGHEVYLREGEAVFVFRGPNVAARVGQAMRSPALWRAGIAWRDCIVGPPEIARTTVLASDETPAYRWTADSQQGRQRLLPIDGALSRDA